jgi:aspartate beta-hydroxylase
MNPNPNQALTPTPNFISLAELALSRGDGDEAMSLCLSALTATAEPTTLLQAGQFLLRLRRFSEATRAFRQLAEREPGSPQSWIFLAMALRGTGQIEAEGQALRSALQCDPRDLLALTLSANRFERLRLPHQAIQAYEAIVAVADSIPVVAAALQLAVDKARACVHAHRARRAQALDATFTGAWAGLPEAESRRFRESLDLLLGRKKRFDPAPMKYYLPHTRTLEFYDRAEFPWLAGIEAQTAAIARECLDVVGRNEGLAPYLTYPSDAPLDQWRELNQSLRWSAYHLIKDGEVVEPNALRCPVTMAALQAAPQPVQPGRTPSAMFSLLKPGTHIPPHVGVSNARLVVHIPLIIPPDCALRVGNQTRQWQLGEALIFDDTIEHEAWNRSDELRAVLIFDIWHPDLTPSERRWIAMLSEAEMAFQQSPGGFDL